MSKKISLSVVISAFNEEAKIEDCLKSVKWAREIIFIDNSSTDKTVEIAKKYTSKIFVVKNNLMLNVNKNFGFTKATQDWILSLDADEQVTPELEEEIEEKIRNSKFEIRNSVDGYYIPRKNIIFGKWIEHAGWYPDWQLRLFKRGKGKFEEQHVHEMIKINTKAGYLNSNILHYNYQTIIQFIMKTANIYAPNEADQLIKNGYKFNWRDAIRFPVKEFMSRFFAREGYRDGFHGLMLSLLMSFYHLVIVANIWEKKGLEKFDNENIAAELEKEVNKSYKDMSFWITNEKIKKISNPIKKIFYKIHRKISNQNKR